MASSGRTLTVYLAADTRKAQAQLGLFGNALKGLKSIAGPALLAGAAYGLVEFGKSAVGAASDLAEVSSKVDVLFGDQAATVKAWSESANTAMGQTQTQALDAASTFAVLGKAANLTGSELGTFSMDLTTLASDLASFNNINPADAVLKLGAALRGEAEPARSMGILINQAATESKALELGLTQAGEAMSSQAAIMARYQLILEQSTDAQGDFERTSDGIANQSRITEATISELSTTFGTSFVAAASEAEYGQKDLNAALEDAKPLFEAAGRAAGNYAAQVIDAAGAAGQAVQELSKSYEEQAWWAKTLSYTWHILSTPLDELITETVTLGRVTDGAAADTSALSGKQYQLGSAYDYAAARAAANANAVANAARVAAAAAGKASAASSTWNSGYVRQAQQANELSKRLKAVAAAADAANKSTGSSSSGSSSGNSSAGVNAAQEKRKQIFQDQASALQDQVRELDALTKGWQAAKKQMDDYASSIADAITSQISLASAWQAQQDDQAKEAGEQTGVTWLQAFQQQIADSKALGEALKGLAAQPGVSQALVDQVAGVANSAGVSAATELVKGITGTEGLGAQLSTDLAGAWGEAGAIGSTFAQGFYGEGVISANKLVQGMVDTVKESKAALRKLGKSIGEPIADEILKAIRAALAEARVANRGTAGVSSFGATPTLTTSSSGSGAVRGAYQGSPSINIQTGVGDPVAIARAVQRVLAQGAMRAGAGA